MNDIVINEWISNLDEKHLQDLRASGLSDEMIYEGKFRSISPEEASERLGFQIKSRCLLIPYFDPTTFSITHYCRVKPDDPPVIEGKEAKYLSPKASTNRLYILPTLKAVLQNTSVELDFTEGEKKAAKACQEGRPCISIPGVWNWAQKNNEEDKNKSEERMLLADFDMINLQGRKVNLIFDSDARRNSMVRLAETAFANALKKKGAKVSVLRLPPGNYGTKNGLDDYLVHNSVRSLEGLPQVNPSIWGQVEEIRSRKKMLGFKKKREVSDLVIRTLHKTGFLINSGGRLFYYYEQNKRVYPLCGEQFELLVSDTFGLNPTENEFAYLMREIQLEASLRGAKTQIHHIWYYCEKNNRLYFNSFDDFIYKLNGESIEAVHNGADGILFQYDTEFDPIRYSPELHKPGAFIDKVLARFVPDEGVISAEHQRNLLKTFLISMPFSSILPTRPILLFYGQKGSGKTSMLRVIGRFLFGRAFNVFSLYKNKEDAFLAAISKYQFVAYDNVDENVPWLNDNLARIATGQKIVLRELYTTNKVMEVLPDTFVGLSSRSPKFRRDDVAERTLVFLTKRISSFIPENILLAEIDCLRDIIWADYFQLLNQVIKRMPELISQGIQNHRMADFANLGFKINKVFGEEEVFLQALENLALYKSSFVIEEDPLLFALSEFLKASYRFDEPYTASALLDELQAILISGGFSGHYKNPVSLARRLRNIKDELSAVLGVELEIVRNTHNHQNSYIFRKNSPY